jgi:hypothetical protein
MARAGAGLAAARRKIGSARRVHRIGWKTGRAGQRITAASTVKGADFSKEMRDSVKAVKDLRPSMKRGAELIVALMNDSFKNQASPDGTPWAPLAKSTLRARVNRFIGGRGGKTKTWKRRGGTVRTQQSPAQRAAQTRKNRYETREIAGTRTKRVWRRGRYITVTYESTRKTRWLKEKFRRGVAEGMTGGVKILEGETGNLKRGMHATAVGKRTIVFGGNVDYLTYHVTGTKGPGSKTMPKRTPVPVEWIAGKWKTINRGPAKLVFDQIARDIALSVPPSAKVGLRLS